MNLNNHVWMLIGVPGSGKSTWAKQKKNENEIILSTDDIIEEMCAANNMTYDEGFSRFIKSATNLIDHLLEKAIRENMSIIWDQTNLTVKSRRAKLVKIPKKYHVCAMVFPIPADLERRLANRPGKTIPKNVLDNMIKSFQYPTYAEGFHAIWDRGIGMDRPIADIIEDRKQTNGL